MIFLNFFLKKKQALLKRQPLRLVIGNYFQDVDGVLTLIHTVTQLNKTCRNKMTSVKGLNNHYIKKSQFAAHLG